MNKTWLIIKREFSTRVRKKTFIIMTLLGPLLMAAVFVLPAYLATLPQDTRTLLVLDEPTLLDFDRGNDDIRLRYLPPAEFDREKALAFYEDEDDYAFLYIPMTESGDPDFIGRNAILYTQGDVSPSVESYIENRLADYIQREKLKAQGVEPDILARTKTIVNLRVYNLDQGRETENLAIIKMGIGYVCAFVIYIFIFIYGAQIMRGVIEEKTSRIVEIMVSTVKPFQLMMGKILGLAGLALLQYLVWLLFGLLFYSLAVTFILGDALDPAQVAEAGAADSSGVIGIFQSMDAINFPFILGWFFFYFLFGYLLYAALFAAIGSAVDKESDSQQFMLPVSLPLIAAIIVLIRALDSPDGAIAQWFSLIPFTSPIVMMARLPFGVVWYELLLSAVILVGSFVAITWMAGRIYRTGILLYGKKPRLGELLKWITYRS